MRTKTQQKDAMMQKAKPAETHLAEDLAGMLALIVLLVAGLHLPLLI